MADKRQVEVANTDAVRAQARMAASVADAAKAATEASLVRQASVARAAKPNPVARRDAAMPPAPAIDMPAGSTPAEPLAPASPAETEIGAIETAAAATIAPPAALAAQSTPRPTTRPATSNTSLERVMTTAEELISFHQANFEALIKSGQIWAAGLQDLGRTWVASTQAQIDDTLGTVKALASAKSLREAVELQSTLARNSVEKVVSEGGKLTDASIRLAEQTMAPITARLTFAAERFARPAA